MEKGSVIKSDQAVVNAESVHCRHFRDHDALMGVVRSIADATTDAQHQDEEEKMRLVLAEIANEETSHIAFDSAQI